MGKGGVLSKYLTRYAEPTAAWARGVESPRYRAAVVVPLFDESPDSLLRLLNTARSGPRLFVLVFNAPVAASAEERLRTQECLRMAIGLGRAVRHSTPLGDGSGGDSILVLRREVSPETDLLVVDATTRRYCLGEKEGVGRARKMGCDAALSLYERGRIQGPYLGMTDGDARLPDEYFAQLNEEQDGAPSCLSFPYRHEPSGNDAIDSAMNWVEAGFRQHVLGLFRAGSPYAYHSLGSAMAVSYERYAEVRGVPNRQAGEDFHLLNKLVKLAPLARVNSSPVRLLSRVSTRVPFGTGPSLHRAIEPIACPLLRHPDNFSDLELFLRIVTPWLRSPELPPPSIRSPEWLLAEVNALTAKLKPSLEQCPTSAHRLRRFHEQFDALDTLQFIHRRERAEHPKVLGTEMLAGGNHTIASFLPSLQLEEESLPRLVGPTVSPEPGAVLPL